MQVLEKILRKGDLSSEGVFLWERYSWLSPDLREKKSPSFPEEKPLFRDFPGIVAILLDDVGNSAALAEDFGDFPFPLTWAILPGERDTSACRRIAEDREIPYIIHMPMQALSDREGSYWYRKNWIVEGMTASEVREQVDRAFRELPGALGMNNHRGSRITENPKILEPLMEILGERGLFFLDSRTSSRSVAAKVALEKGLPKLENHVFLDHREEEAFFRSQMKRLFHLAEERGWAVGICHARPSTYRILEKMERDLEECPFLKTLPELVDFLRR